MRHATCQHCAPFSLDTRFNDNEFYANCASCSLLLRLQRKQAATFVILKTCNLKCVLHSLLLRLQRNQAAAAPEQEAEEEEEDKELQARLQAIKTA